MATPATLEPEGFEAWRLVLVGRLILNSAGLALTVLSCALLRKLRRGRRHLTSISALLHLSYAELVFAVTSQCFSVLFLASHSSETAHSRSSPMQHNKLIVLVALAGCGSVKHSSLFVRQWLVLLLCCLHCCSLARPAVSGRVSRRGCLRCLVAGLWLLGAAFGAVRLVAEKVPEYFRKTYITEQQHESIHSVLQVLEFGLPPLLLAPAAVLLLLLLLLMTPRRRTGGEYRQPEPRDRRVAASEDADDAVAGQLSWSRRCSQSVLAISLLFLVCQCPLLLFGGFVSDTRLLINLQDLLASVFSCGLFAVIAGSSSTFREKLNLACACTVTPADAQRDTVLDSCCQMQPAAA